MKQNASRYEQRVHGKLPVTSSGSAEGAQGFDYLATDKAARLPVGVGTITALDALGASMVTEAGVDVAAGDATFPPVYTYWGQFIDHDITLSANLPHTPFDVRPDDFRPLTPESVRAGLFNQRTRNLDLDSVYGGGPRGSAELYCPGHSEFHCCPALPGTLRIGRTVPSPGEVPPPEPENLCRDLPRDPAGSARALIGDARNDENLIVAQFHLAVLRFHNEALEALGDFEAARNETRMHYQWLILHDFLQTIADSSVVQDILYRGGRRLGFAGDFVPVEFSGGAYRFGHSMVRAAYDYNVNFGRGEILLPTAPIDQIFRFTGNPRTPNEQPLGGNERLPSNWIIDWSRFAHRGGSFRDGRPERFSRKIDTHLSQPLGQMRNEGADEPQQPHRILMRHLGRRNLRRGYLLGVPTGQAMAELCGEAALTRAELLDGTLGGARPDMEDALKREGGLLLDHTPLWFYVLKEAELLGSGQHLGPVGSRIVVETIVGLLSASDDSVLSREWTPAQSELDDEIRSIDDFLRFAGVLA